MDFNPEHRKYTCCMCEQEHEGWGNNPEPLMDNSHGEVECCDNCNTLVITERLHALIGDYDDSPKQTEA